MVRLRGLTSLPKSSANGESGNKGERGASKPETATFRIEADSADSFAPLSISGRWKRTKMPRRVSLYVDGTPRAGAEALATPVNDAENGYTIVFLPTATDIGVRDLEVRVEGEEKPIYQKKVEVRVKGARSLEMKKVS